MKICVTGAYGFLGANIVAEALQRGYDVRALYARNRVNPLFNPADVEALPLDITDPGSVKRATRACDAVIHMAGVVDFRRSKRKWVWDVNVLGTKHLFEACLRNDVSRVVDASSIAALGTVQGHGLADERSANPYTEDNPSAFKSPAETASAIQASESGDYRFLARSRLTYFDAKLAAHELAKDYRLHRALPVITVFPGTAVGAGDIHASISQLIDSVWEGRLSLTYPGGSCFMDAGDFARGAISALERGRLGEGYILAGKDGDSMSYAAFMRLIARVAAQDAGRREGRGGPLVLPKPIALGASIAAELLVPGLGLSYGLALSACHRHAYTSAKAREEIGYEPVTPLIDSIRSCRAFSESLAKRGLAR
jgi:dihydroflavonol-4-reductase